ncbi:tRNA (cytosine(38)-C(5))-methyltransferase isoform X2 [Protopterus annectens]|uniref:tRNA (cytosine(38)-C(5))-methyltransferase isoform X2 n=1 Tax=Protopterus annectens TaxID=7888 RepID=UPI001CF9815C|nr:tRNA (cytosine(38)-C(5))-methyltransferase isoform X2 [Protopterus annectens]
MILMSPPCQPFTRIGLQGDVMDPRTKSFLHILDILPSLKKLPKCILLENVKGFETSSARDKLIVALKNCGYVYQEFLLSPTCIGIPNSRLRYFLIAKHKLEPLCFQVTTQILDRFPEDLNTTNLESSSCIHEDVTRCGTSQQIQNSSDNCCKEHPEKKDFVFKMETEEEVTRKQNQDNNKSIQELHNYLEKDVELNMSLYLIPPKSLLRYALIMDIVKPTSRRSICFTKGYGHYIEGTGSVLQTAHEVEMLSVGSASGDRNTRRPTSKIPRIESRQPQKTDVPEHRLPTPD